jgi:NitT/TauT family transport system ATP-binding protein
LQKVKLELKNVSKFFATNGEKLDVLDSINFQVYEKEFLTIVGPSGCGKTTLIRIIAGLVKPDTGSITLEDKKVKGPLKRIGYIPQQFSLYPWLTVKQNVMFGLHTHGVKKAERMEKVNELLQLVGLSDFRDYYPKDISGGMKQKVAIIRSLAIDQTVLLLDEPLVSIDAQNRNKLQQDLVDIWKKSKRTIIFITHNIDEAVFLSDRILVMRSIPSSIKECFEIHLPRPRNRTGDEFNSIRQKILSFLDIN